MQLYPATKSSVECHAVITPLAGTNIDTSPASVHLLLAMTLDYFSAAACSGNSTFHHINLFDLVSLPSTISTILKLASCAGYHN